MISSFGAYLLLVSTLLAGGAWASEQAFLVRRWPRRFLWLATLAASVLFPLAMALHVRPVAPIRTQPYQLEFLAPAATQPAQWHALHPVQVKPPAPSAAVPAAPPAPAARSQIRLSRDQMAGIIWLSSSIVTALWYVLAGAGLARLVRRAPRAAIQGVTVRITPATGPAVFGVLRPVILWPRWLDQAPVATRAAAIAHEKQHLAAGDPLVLAVGLMLVVVAPWNPALWWQLRRMRFAMEADCDQRVVRGGTDGNAYARALLQLAEHRASGGAGLAMLMSAPSWLERRVRILLKSPGRRTALLAAVGLPLALGAWVAVAQLPAPTLRGAELRMLPPEDTRPGADWARAIARSRYRALFDRHFDGTAVVAVIFNHDGTLRLADEHLFAPGVVPSDLDLAIENQRAGVEYNDLLYGCSEHGEPDAPDSGWRGAISSWGKPYSYCTIGPWLDTVNAGRVFVVYEVLAWEPDPSRSAARVEAALRASAPEVFVPPDPEAHERLGPVTLFMNDDGTVGRLSIIRCHDEVCEACDLDKVCKGPPSTAEYFARFAAMGISRERLGRRGTFSAAGEVWVDYAWPRRPDDSPGTWSPSPNIQPVTGCPVFADDPRVDCADDERIAERYFHKVQMPDVETERCWPQRPNALQGCSQTLPTPWVLLGRDGRVWDAGFGPGGATFEYVESRYPGIRVDKGLGHLFRGANDFSQLTLLGANGFTIWVAPDSPIQKKSDVDLEKQKAFLVTGTLISTLTAMSISAHKPVSIPSWAWLVAAADLGVPVEMRQGRWRSMPRDGAGVEVTVTQADQAKITMNVRTSDSIPARLGLDLHDTRKWTQTARVEAPYGQATTIELPGDTPDQRARLLVQVERLKQ